MNILHATTDPTLLQRLKQMLASAHAADSVGCATGMMMESASVGLRRRHGRVTEHGNGRRQQWHR